VVVPNVGRLSVEVRQWADRKKRVGFPLFPGYVFARFELRNVHEVLHTSGLVTIVRNNGIRRRLRMRRWNRFGYSWLV